MFGTHGFVELIFSSEEVHDPITSEPSATGTTEAPSLFTTSNLAPAEISFSTTAAWPLLAADCSAVQPQMGSGS